MIRRATVTIILTGLLFLTGMSAATATGPVTTDVLDQGGGTVYSTAGARIVRQANGIAASVTMPTPEPGSYLYPAGTVPGHPEVFTLWMFVFNHPEHCSGPCGPDDMTNPAVEFGVYNPAGHVTGGGSLTLSGRIGVGDPAGAPPGITPYDLSNPTGAEVHLAVTSHGGIDASALPGEFQRPTGSGACSCWWVAIFD